MSSDTPFIELLRAITQKALEDNKSKEQHEKRLVNLHPEIAEQILFEIDELKEKKQSNE